MNKKRETGWGKVADWYHGLVEDKTSYQRDLLLPNLLRLLALQAGTRIADIGCGEGLFVRAFARAGAAVTGVDVSKELIAIAKREAAQENEHYKTQPRLYVGSADALSMIEKASQDVVVSVLAIQNIENLNGTLSECARIVKPNGRLLLVLNHPAFRIPKASDWQWSEDGKTQYRRVWRYMSELREKIDMQPSRSGATGADRYTLTFHRPLQVYLKALRTAGFAVVNMEEWISNKKSQPGPRAAAENRARVEIPLFMMLEAKQL